MLIIANKPIINAGIYTMIDLIKMIDEKKIFEFYLLGTIKRSKAKTASHFGLTTTALQKMFTNGSWDEKAKLFDAKTTVFLKSGEALQALYTIITNKLKNEDKLEEMTLENLSKIATTLVKLIPDLELATLGKVTPELQQAKSKSTAYLDAIRNDTICMKHIYQIVERIREIDIGKRPT
jgi:hypothetical protein